MGRRADKAVEYFLSGCSCAQSVYAAFADCFGIDEGTAMQLASGFGGGIGRMRETCGGFSGTVMVIGQMIGSKDGTDQEAKERVYREVQDMAEAFRRENGSLICRELLGLTEEQAEAESPVPDARTKEYYSKRPCEEIIRAAAELIEERYPKTR